MFSSYLLDASLALALAKQRDKGCTQAPGPEEIRAAQAELMAEQKKMMFTIWRRLIPKTPISAAK